MSKSDVYLQLANGNTLSVMEGDLLLPFIGNWSAHLVLAEGDAAPTGLGKVVWLGDESTSYIIRSGENEGRFSVLAVGGQGGFWKTVPSKMYDYRLKLSLPLTEMLSSVGESLSSKSSIATTSLELSNWVRTTSRCDELLSKLTDQAKAIWRVLPDGTVFVGVDTWPTAPNFEYSLQWQDPTWSSATFIVTSLSLRPGQRFPISTLPISNRKVSCVRYEISPTVTRMTVWFADESFEDDPLHAGLATFVKQTMRYVDFYAQYPAEVLLQRSDGTLDVIPDSKYLPPMTSVPVNVPVGGTKIKVMAGERVRILFSEGDPTKYSAQLYDSGSGGRLLVRQGGEVDGGSVTLSVAGMGVTIGGSYTDGFGNTTNLPPSTSVTFNIKGNNKDGWPRWEVGNES